jgi:hypothetical protein
VVMTYLNGGGDTILVDLIVKARVMAVWEAMCLIPVVSLRKRLKVEVSCVRVRVR